MPLPCSLTPFKVHTTPSPLTPCSFKGTQNSTKCPPRSLGARGHAPPPNHPSPIKGAKRSAYAKQSDTSRSTHRTFPFDSLLASKVPNKQN